MLINRLLIKKINAYTYNEYDIYHIINKTMQFQSKGNASVTAVLFLLPLGKPAEFKVFTKGAGVKGSVQVTCIDESGAEADCKVKDNDDGTFTITYVPKNPGKYVITIKFMDEEIPKSPIKVTIIPFSDPTKVKATGPGLEGKRSLKQSYPF